MPRKTWPTERGYKQFLLDCECGKYDACGNVRNLDQWVKNVKGNGSLVDVRCQRCLYTTSVVLRNFHIRKSARCFCTGAVRWSTKEGHARLLEIVGRSRFRASQNLMSFEWWSSQPRDNYSHVSIICKECGVISENVQVNSFVRNQTAACGCLWKTERMVAEFVLDYCKAYDAVSVVRQYPLGKMKKPLHCDIAVLHHRELLLAVEVDGAQHFRDNTQFAGITSHDLQTRDLIKERAATASGASLIRIYQEDAWLKKFDWQSFISDFIDKALARSLTIGVYHQPHVLYQKGIYARMRQGSVACVA